MIDVHERLVELLSQGERVAVATVVRGRGSTPRGAGAKMLVLADGRSFFSVGGGALEASVAADCRAALEGGGAVLRVYDLTEAGRNSVGMTCGGTVEVFIEVEEPVRRLFVFGAGHVGRALARAAPLAGLAVTVVDDRADWLAAEAFPPGTALHRCGRDYAHDLPEVGEDACVAVMTRCHATDVNVLGALAGTPLRYLGFIGSRRKIARALRALKERGVDEAWLAGVQGPIGLDIGAETPGEIALAVAAELVTVLRRKPGRAAAPRLALR